MAGLEQPAHTPGTSTGSFLCLALPLDEGGPLPTGDGPAGAQLLMVHQKVKPPEEDRALHEISVFLAEFFRWGHYRLGP